MLNPDEHQLSQRLIEFFEKLQSWEHTVVKESGLSLPQMHTIEIIGHHNGLTMKSLAEKMGITTGTLTVMIDRLTKLELVQRNQNPEDRRSYLITLTDKGMAHFEEHEKLHFQLTQEIIAPLSETETEQFSGLLEKILTNF